LQVFNCLGWIVHILRNFHISQGGALDKGLDGLTHRINNKDSIDQSKTK
jgi:hypothetical protein